MLTQTTLNKLQEALAKLEQQYKSTYITPEAIDALMKTIKTFNITINDWNTLIEYIHVAGLTLDSLYAVVPELATSIIEAQQTTEQNLKQYTDDSVQALKDLVDENYAQKTYVDNQLNLYVKLTDIDTDFSLTSTNPIQNKVVSKQIKDINYAIMTMKEELFETVLSEIDYKVDYATIYPIPETLSDDDGTHRVVYSDTQLKEIEGNSVAFNQLLMPYNSNLNADYYFCECENMVLENCSYLKQTGDNYKTDFIDSKCGYGSFHAEAYLGYSAPYEASGRGFVHNFNVDEDVSSMTYTFNAPGGGKADLILRGATNIVNTGNYSATALNVGTAVNIELNGVSINHLIKSTDNFVGKAPGQADPQNRNTTHAETGFSLDGRYLYLLWTDVTIKGVSLSVGKNTLKITAKNGIESGHWDSVKFDITPYKNGGSSEGEANKEIINGITFINNGDGSFSVSGTATANTIKVFLSKDWDIGHSYLVRGLFDNGIDGSVCWYDNSNGQQFSSSKDYIFKPTSTNNNRRKVALMIRGGTMVGFTFFPQVHDLTNMSLDSIISVEEFNRIFTLTYYPYNTGKLLSSKVSGVRIRNSKLATVPLNKISVVNLGALNWSYDSKNKLFFSSDLRNVLIKPKQNFDKKYSQLFDSYGYYLTQQSFYEQGNTMKDISVSISHDGVLRLRNLAYTNATAFKTAMNGVLLYFECVKPQETISQEIVNEFVNKTINIPQTELLSAGSVHDTIKIVEGNVVAGQQRYNMVSVSKTDNVDLGTLNWTWQSANNRWFTNNLSTLVKVPTSNDNKANIIAEKYEILSFTNANTNSRGMALTNSGNLFYYTSDGTNAPSGILNYEKVEYTETTLATDLTFEEVSAIIEQGGSIETIFEIVPPNLKTAFVVNKAIVS